MASIRLQVETDKIILNYKHKSSHNNLQPMEYPVRLDWTACTLGGQRAWLLCPAIGCGRRVALLYIGDSGLFSCRHCLQLAYISQRESTGYRAMRRANRIRESLGWEDGILNSAGNKPKGMHWRTFNRLNAEHDDFVKASLLGMMRKVERLVLGSIN